MTQIILEKFKNIKADAYSKKQLDFTTVTQVFESLANFAREENFREALRSEDGIQGGFCILDLYMEMTNENNPDSQKNTEIHLELIEQSLRLINNCCIGNRSEVNLKWAEFQPSNAITLSKVYSVLILKLEQPFSAAKSNIINIFRAFVSVVFNASILSKNNNTLFNEHGLSPKRFFEIVQVFNSQLCSIKKSNNSEKIKLHNEWDPLVSLVINYIDSIFEEDEKETLDNLSRDCASTDIIIKYIINSFEMGINKESQESLFFIFYKLVVHARLIRVGIVERDLFIPLIHIYEFMLKVHTPTSQSLETQPNSQLNIANGNSIKNNHIVYSKQCEAMNRVFAEVTGEDENIEALFTNNELLDYMKMNLDPTKIKRLGEKNGPEIILLEGVGLAILVILGNLARKDEYSEFYANSVLTEYVIGYWVTRTSNVDIRSCFAACGLIRNLCILDKNKEKLVNLGILHAIYPWYNSSVLPIQTKVLGIYRHLTLSKIPDCSAKYVTTRFFLHGCDNSSSEDIPESKKSQGGFRISQIVDISKNSTLDSVRCESVRLLIAVLKVLIIEFKEDERDSSVELMSSLNIIEPIVKLVVVDGSHHQLLAIEGIDCLSVLGAFDSKPNGYAHQIIEILDTSFELKPKSKTNIEGLNDESISNSEKTSLFASLMRIITNHQISEAGPIGQESTSDTAVTLQIPDPAMHATLKNQIRQFVAVLVNYEKNQYGPIAQTSQSLSILARAVEQ